MAELPYSKPGPNRVFYDCEFLEDGKTIDLISIGMVNESTGEELYLVNRDMPVRRIRKHQWLMDNVVPGLPKGHGDMRNSMSRRWLFHYGDRRVQPKAVIADRVARFLTSVPHLELWAWYGAYDHVCLAQLWGPMIQLPAGIPMWTNDLKQEAQRLGNPRLPEQERGVHNALEDARHNMVRAHVLDRIRSEVEAVRS